MFVKSSRNAAGSAALIAALGLAATVASVAAAQTPGSISATELQEQFLTAHPGTGFIEENGAIARVYGAAFSTGASPSESADAFLQANAGILSSSFANLMAVGPNADGTHVLPVSYDPGTDSYRFSLVGYTQHVNGVPVFRGDVRCLVRNEPGYPLVLVSNALRDLGDFAQTFSGRPVAPSKIDLRKVSRQPLNQFGPGATISHQEQVIWAGYDGTDAAEPRLAIKFIVTGTGVFDRDLYQRMLYVVDSATGKILFQEDQISHADVNVTIRGNATLGTAADACGAEGSKPLPYARVTYGTTTLYTGAAGTLSILNGSSTLSITSTTIGRWFAVNDVPATESTITLSSAGGSLDFFHNAANTDEGDRAEVNAYIESNAVRDWTLAYNPSFPTIATQQSFPVNVRVSGTCNAFYDGTSINFYPAGGGCNNTAFSVVVHHEYGHHLVNVAGSGQGAYGEGFGDVMGVLLTDESRLAVGFQTCTTGIRDANNTCQYSATGCSSCGSAIHSCGQLLSGCVWDLRNNLLVTKPATYRQILSDLAVNSVLVHSGTSITNSITVDFLTLDDDNANIGDGTPHYSEINGAFSDHGLPGPALQLLSFAFPNGQPSLSNPAGGTQVAVNIGALAAQPAANSGKLFYRNGSSGAFTQVNMTPGSSANSYIATLPSAACPSTLQYYFAASTTTGSTVTSPSDAPTSFYSVAVASGINAVFTDTIETVTGWTTTTAGDTATTGLWLRGDPLGTVNGSTPVQPDNDVTAAPGVNCFFTGQGTAGGTLGEADVDGGFTTLTSPTINASAGDAYISYYRWYSNSQGGAPNADTFRVQISNNNGASWVALETVGPTGAEVNGGWYLKEFRVADFVTPTAQVKIRFIADDAGTGSLIEAAVDEVRLKVVECQTFNPADLNQDGAVNGEDLAALLNAWGTPAGDIDGNNLTDGADLALLLGAWTL
jgi:hypothetical protein